MFILRYSVSGILTGLDPELESITVENLSTPIGIYRKSILRSSDVCLFSIPARPSVPEG